MSAQRHSAAIGGGETVKACASKQVATAAKSSKSTDPSPLQSADAAGEPPYMARKKYDHKLLESLAKGDKLVDKAAELAAAGCHWRLARQCSTDSRLTS